LGIGRGEVTRGVASSALYWPANEVGSQTPGRLRLGDLNLRYTSCHISRSALVVIHEVLFRAPSLEVVGIRSSGESSGRSSGGRVGCQLGRLGPLTGRRVF
jgi:hypothetical protein